MNSDLQWRAGAFRLDSGVVLPDVKVAYITLGKLNPQHNNAILMTHGFTSSHRFILADTGAAEGSWSALVGPGLAIDTERYFVISTNALGSCYGTTGSGSVRAPTLEDRVFGFPAITLSDMVRLQRNLLHSMGIERLHAVAGVSMGGFQALQWGVQYPDAMDRLVVALSAPTGRAVADGAGDLEARIRTVISGNDDTGAVQQLTALLTQMRIATLRRYGMQTWLQDQGLDDGAQIRELSTMAAVWAQHFEAGSLLTLRQAIARFDVRSQLDRIRARLFYLLCTTDALFPAGQQGEKDQEDFAAAGVNVQFEVLDSRYGHLASGLDAARWAGKLQAFLCGAEKL